MDSDPIALIEKINTLPCNAFPENVRKKIPSLYSLIFDLLRKIKPHPDFIKFADEIKMCIEDYQAEKDIKQEDKSDQFYELKNALEKLKDYKNFEIGDDGFAELCSLIFSPIEDIFISLFNDDKSRQKFVKLTNDNLVQKAKEYMNKVNATQVCTSFCDGTDNIALIEAINEIDIFDFISMVSCQKCFKTEEAHQTCSVFLPQFASKYKCQTCGGSSSKHAICDNFCSNGTAECFLDLYCTNCGMNYYSHKEKIEKTSFCCMNYIDNGNKICNNCQFEMQDHLNSTSFNLLPKELRRSIGDKYLFFSLKSISSSDKNLLVINEFILNLFRVKNYREVARTYYNMPQL
jgi:hypothetical protein